MNYPNAQRDDNEDLVGFGITILLAEDDHQNRLSLIELFEGEGYTVIPARNGSKAKDIYDERAEEIDCIVSDLDMPGLSGIEFARYNSLNKHLPFVVSSGVLETDVAEELMEIGVRDFMVKPYDFDLIPAVIQKCIERFNLANMTETVDQNTSGNLSTITIPTCFEDMHMAVDWIEKKVERFHAKQVAGHFASSISELLTNAYEHGNLGITECEKKELMRQGTFHDEVLKRERNCKAKIKIDVLAFKHKVTVKIYDEGEGFDYRKYVDLKKKEIEEKLALPNGRGIYLANYYFDSITYKDKGATVIAVKSF
ncbi:MAG: response regulator [Nitrospinae bacterium]|nr:response regulator [Nitrospinota bacterium]